MFEDVGRETHVLEQVTEGMSVIGSDGEHLGKIDMLKMGDPEAATTEGNEPIGGTTNLMMTPVIGITPMFGTSPEPHIPEPRRSQLVRVGFIRVHHGPLSTHHSYYGADEIASVRDGTVILAPAATTAGTTTPAAPTATAATASEPVPLYGGATDCWPTPANTPAPTPADTWTVPAEPVHVTQPAATSGWTTTSSDSDSAAALKALGIGSGIGVALAGGSLWAYRWWQERQKPTNRLRRTLHRWQDSASKHLPDASPLLDHAPDVDLNARTGRGLGAAALAVAGLVWLLRDRSSADTELAAESDAPAMPSLPEMDFLADDTVAPGTWTWVAAAAAAASVGLGAALAWWARRGGSAERPGYVDRVDSDLVTAHPVHV